MRNPYAKLKKPYSLRSMIVKDLPRATQTGFFISPLHTSNCSAMCGGLRRTNPTGNASRAWYAVLAVSHNKTLKVRMVTERHLASPDNPKWGIGARDRNYLQYRVRVPVSNTLSIRFLNRNRLGCWNLMHVCTCCVPHL